MHRDGIILIIAVLCLAYIVVCVKHRGIVWYSPGLWPIQYGRVFVMTRIYLNWKRSSLVTVRFRKSRWF